MLLAVLPATAPRKPRCRSMLLRWRTARLRVIDQRHCRVQRSTANVICMQIAICARSPSEPEHQPPTRHWHYPHSARTLSSGFVQSGFYEVALMPALLASPYHATSQNPQDSLSGRTMIRCCIGGGTMRPKKHATTGESDLFRARLDQIINTGAARRQARLGLA
jgi:hypothetical protein